jgi:hypothetical protein
MLSILVLYKIRRERNAALPELRPAVIRLYTARIRLLLALAQILAQSGGNAILACGYISRHLFWILFHSFYLKGFSTRR